MFCRKEHAMSKPMLTRGIVVFCILGLSLLIWSTWGEAHRSGCHRWHSCPSDTGSYVCGNLGYCSQCPNNSYCQGGEPRPAFPPPPTVPPPPPALSLLLNQPAFTAGQTLGLIGIAAPQGALVDVYVGLLLPSGEFFFLTPGGSLTATPQPLTPFGLADAASAEIFRYTLTGSEPSGPYTWMGV